MFINTKLKSQSVSAYFKSLGIKNCFTKEDFWRHVTEVDSFLAKELQPIMERKLKGNLYEVKNRTLPFSLAVESWTLNFHQSLLNWINQQTHLKPKRILEIGCDNGLLSCWFASVFPDAEIVGIEQCGNGIQCAQQLAIQQGLNNVSFYQMDFMEVTEHFSLNSFDLIISSRTFHEIMGPIMISNYWSLLEYMKENPTYGDSRYLEIVHRLLTEDGLYLSCEQLKNSADLGRWANVLQDAGFHIQWDDSSTIEYHEIGVDRLSPVIVATKRETSLETLKGMEHLYTKGFPLVFEEGRSYKGGTAEFAYQQLGEKTFFTGIQLKVMNHWHVFRLELWETDRFLLVYNYGNMGYHELDILPACAYEEAHRLMEEAVGEFGHLGPLVWYHNLDERPE
jgi:hypothetical protein